MKKVDRCPTCLNKNYETYVLNNKEKPIKVIKKIAFPNYDIRVHVCLQCNGPSWESIERPVSCTIRKEENKKVDQIRLKLTG